MSPFDFITSISEGKAVVFDDLTEKSYNAFMVNRGLSYFPDTVLFANEMNQYPGIDKKMQFDFLSGAIRKRKRFSKWLKPTESEDIQTIQDYYKYSKEKARAALSILSSEKINELRLRMHHGGKSGPAKSKVG